MINMGDIKKITVAYFAVLREQRGTSEEQIETSAGTGRELFAELKAKHGFTLEPSQLKLVVNEEFREWDTVIGAGDTVVFIPPVAGG